MPGWLPEALIGSGLTALVLAWDSVRLRRVIVRASAAGPVAGRRMALVWLLQGFFAWLAWGSASVVCLGHAGGTGALETLREGMPLVLGLALAPVTISIERAWRVRALLCPGRTTGR